MTGDPTHRRRGVVTVQMASFSPRLAAVAAVLALVSALSPVRQAGAVKLVHCYEQDRKIVRQTAANACAGRVINADEAQAIRDQRARYVQGSVAAPPPVRPNAIGSGFFVSARGDVLTNRHVVESCRRISLLTPDGKTIPANLVSVSGTYDLVLLRTDARPNATAAFASDQLENGHPVTITGFPVRKLPLVRPETTRGLYLRQRQGGSDGVMELAATVWGGSSGSSVVSRNGTVAGMVFARNDRSRAAGTIAHPAPDRAYAIPASALRAFLAARAVQFRAADAQDTAPDRYTVRVNCQ
jgi:S1-C subfamily serine protease